MNLLNFYYSWILLLFVCVLLLRPWHLFISIIIFLVCFLNFQFLIKPENKISDNSYLITKKIKSGFIANNTLILSKLNLLEGDLIKFKGKIQSTKKLKKSFKNYCLSLNVNHFIKNPKISVTKKNSTLRSKIFLMISNSRYKYFKTIVNLLILNNKNGNEKLYSKLISLNIIYLFVVSGFHINLLFAFF